MVSIGISKSLVSSDMSFGVLPFLKSTYVMMRAIWLIPSLRKTTTCSLSSILHDSPIICTLYFLADSNNKKQKKDGLFNASPRKLQNH